MRLLERSSIGEYRLTKDLVGKNIPPYAILSHTWGPDTEEVTFKDLMDGTGKDKIGYNKIRFCGEQASDDDLKYFWIDTCCIDKSNSAELHEAVNSMWTWYRRAEFCYAYLSDVPPGTDIEEEDSTFSRSRWFTRGWTLQELLSPKSVTFYDESWSRIGQKSDLSVNEDFIHTLSYITGIPRLVLRYPKRLRMTSVAQKMSWAAQRSTTRVEDVAYSLLGLFGINMPLIYGEGAKAFTRLQEEILKVSDDESIFSWGFSQIPSEHASLLAFSPADFANCGNIVSFVPTGFQSSHYTLTNKGLHIELEICELLIQGGVSLARLNCSEIHEENVKSIVIPLVRSKKDSRIVSRSRESAPISVSNGLFPQSGPHVYAHRYMGHWVDVFVAGFMIQCWLFGEAATFRILEFYPPAWRGVLTHGPFIWDQRANLEQQQQNIFFLVNNFEQPNYAVWLDYKFRLDDEESIHPQELVSRAAIVEKGTSLAEIIIKFGDAMDTALDWVELLELTESELTFEVDKTPDPKGDCWTLHISIIDENCGATRAPIARSQTRLRSPTESSIFQIRI